MARLTINPDVAVMMFRRLSDGETVTMDDDIMESIPYSLPDRAKDHWYRSVRSLPNTERVGLRDKYCVTMTPFAFGFAGSLA